jgi:hypothetical protein
MSENGKPELPKRAISPDSRAETKRISVNASNVRTPFRGRPAPHATSARGRADQGGG